MRVYLAHNFAARSWLREVIKPKIEASGHIVTSRWLWDDSHMASGSEQQSAVHDLEDIESADDLILFTDNYSDLRPGKGKFIELGYAIRASRRCILVGEDQSSSVFYHLPNIRHAKTLEEALRLL